MALKKKTTLASGVEANYYRIDGFTFSKHGSVAVMVGLYVNAAAAAGGKEPVATEQLTFESSALKADLFKGDARDALYPLLKRLAGQTSVSQMFGHSTKGLMHGVFEDA